jgi:glutathione synthase/RimK-type ligase-like ATP-grasp enzyme
MRAVREVERKFAEGLSDRFIHIHKPGKAWRPVTEADEVKQKTPELFDGYVKPDCILVRPQAWRRFCDGFDTAEIARVFEQRGALIANKTEQVVGRSERFYVLSRATLTSLTP